MNDSKYLVALAFVGISDNLLIANALNFCIVHYKLHTKNLI